jgi:Domain of unknown function (DUF1844)
MGVESDGTFKVSDRRPFNPDGTLREDMPADAQAGRPAEPAAAQPATPGPPPPAQSESADRLHHEPPLESEGLEGEASLFSEFLMGIASSAFVYLGMVEHPGTGKREVDLEAAKESIDMLGMLREKTEGNLTNDEENLFENLLAELRMQFVSLRR